MTTGPLPAIAFLTADPKEAGVVTEILAENHWTCFLAHDRSSLEGILRVEDCRGVILGLSTIVRLEPTDREFIVALEPVYPVARLRLGPSGGVVIASAFTGLEPSIDTFIGVCAAWPCRKMRSAERNKLFLHGEMTGADAASERIFTVDISETGAFVHADGTWPVGTVVALHFPLGTETAQLPGVVVRVVPWGDLGQAPGIGIKFEAEAKEAARRVVKLARNRR